ncbi:hypothetical protein TNCV_3311581 [Trichonephila clavipes]|nr:hypothetical protein TNCV_3311581 [Trichonephila clavipes]
MLKQRLRDENDTLKFPHHVNLWTSSLYRGDGSRNFEQRSNDQCNTWACGIPGRHLEPHSPNFHATLEGGLRVLQI